MDIRKLASYDEVARTDQIADESITNLVRRVLLGMGLAAMSSDFNSNGSDSRPSSEAAWIGEGQEGQMGRTAMNSARHI